LLLTRHTNVPNTASTRMVDGIHRHMRKQTREFITVWIKNDDGSTENYTIKSDGSMLGQSSYGTPMEFTAFILDPYEKEIAVGLGVSMMMIYPEHALGLYLSYKTVDTDGVKCHVRVCKP